MDLVHPRDQDSPTLLHSSFASVTVQNKFGALIQHPADRQGFQEPDCLCVADQRPTPDAAQGEVERPPSPSTKDKACDAFRFTCHAESSMTKSPSLLQETSPQLDDILDDILLEEAVQRARKPISTTAPRPYTLSLVSFSCSSPPRQCNAQLYHPYPCPGSGSSPWRRIMKSV